VYQPKNRVIDLFSLIGDSFHDLLLLLRVGANHNVEFLTQS
jgi:hypothetical protein